MIADRIIEHARATPDKPALIHNGIEWRYADFARRVADAHAHVSTLNLQPGGIVVLCMDSLRDSWVWELGLRDHGFNTVAVEKGEDIAPLGLPDIRCVLKLGYRAPSQPRGDCCRPALDFGERSRPGWDGS